MTRSESRKKGQSVAPITKACDMCRQKKIRCDVASGVCRQCIKYKTPCHFTPISTKRAPRRLARDRRVEELEKRLKSMEDLIRGTGSVQPSLGTTGLEAPSLEDLAAVTAPELPALSFSMDPTTISPGENISSPDLVVPSWEDSITPTSLGGSSGEFLPVGNGFGNNGSTGRTFKALPPKEEMLSLMEESFQGLHPAYPLFDKDRLLSMFETLDTSVKDPGLWACVNIVLALTPHFRHESPEHTKDDDEMWGYFQNAHSVAGQLMTMHVTLRSVQALLGMALVIQGTPTQGPVSLLISAAMRLAHRMGLHRRCRDPDISVAEIEERKRVFWIAYALDKDISLQMGQPSAQDDDDMDVELPSPVDDSMPQTFETMRLNFFYFRARLAKIQGQIYKRLYSVKASQQTMPERVAAAKELGAMLQSWRASVPLEFMHDYHEPFLQMPSASSACGQPILLQLLYFNSLAFVYKSLPALQFYHGLPDTSDLTEAHLLSAPVECAAEARKAIKLLQVTPRRKYLCIWAVLHIFVTAATTLLKDIVREPSNPMTLLDLQLIEPLLALLGVLIRSAEGRKSQRLGGIYQSFHALFEEASAAVRKTNLTQTADWDPCVPNGSAEGQESIDDFLRRMDNLGSGFDVDLDSISPGTSREFVFAVQQQFLESTATGR